VVVTGSGHPDSGYTYVIAFDQLTNPGDQPSLRVASTKGLQGTDAAVAFSTVNHGSYDRIYRPIPAEMLNYPVPVASSVQVRRRRRWPARQALVQCTHRAARPALPAAQATRPKAAA
jgi:hypothetical protein